MTKLVFCYDALNREIVKYLHNVACGTAGAATDVFTDYDLAGRHLHVRYQSRTGTGVDYAYDSAGRATSETTFSLAVGYQYDLAGHRTRTTWPDAFYAGYVFDNDGRLITVNENGATTGAGVLATFTYDDLGRRIALTRGNGTSTTYSYDAADRLIALNQDVSGTLQDQSYAFGYNHASELIGRSNSNKLYDWTGASTTPVNHNYNGLNQDSAIALTGGYDANGNLTNDGVSRTFTYDAENRLLTDTVSGVTKVTLSYDPIGRLNTSVAASVTTQYLYDGVRLIAELDGSGNVTERYVHGGGTDEPLVWYPGPTTATRQWLHQDAQGSIIAWSSGTGAVTASQIYEYGPYGEASSWTGSRFRYTGQIMIPEAQLYYYKARVYDPVTGRFLQTDPIGYGADLDLYTYAGNDPLDKADPTGAFPVSFPTIVFDTDTQEEVANTLSGMAITADANGLFEVGLPEQAIADALEANVAAKTALEEEATAASTAGRGVANPVVKQAVENGKKAHAEFATKVKGKDGWKSNPTVNDPTGKALRPDAVTPKGKPVELKPNTKTGRAKGRAQLKRYETAIGQRGRLVCYDPTTRKIVPCG